MKKLLLCFILFVISCDTECGLKSYIVKQDANGSLVGFAREWKDLEDCLIDYNSISRINCYAYTWLDNNKESLQWQDYNDVDLSSYSTYMKKNIYYYFFFIKKENDVKVLYLFKYDGDDNFKRVVLYF